MIWWFPLLFPTTTTPSSVILQPLGTHSPINCRKSLSISDGIDRRRVSSASERVPASCLAPLGFWNGFRRCGGEDNERVCGHHDCKPRRGGENGQRRSQGAERCLTQRLQVSYRWRCRRRSVSSWQCLFSFIFCVRLCFSCSIFLYLFFNFLQCFLVSGPFFIFIFYFSLSVIV